MDIDEIRLAAINEETDYLFLKNKLANYASPRDKITRLLKSKALIRVKKGLYVFGARYARKPYVLETLANLIYGPPYISLEYALSYYGMIPERVTLITSVTCKRNKLFKTPVATFSYRYLPINKYPVGITQSMLDKTHAVFFATPEKALADMIMLNSPGLVLQDKQDITHCLYQDLRIAEDKLIELDLKRFEKIANIYANKNVSKILDYLLEEKNKHE